MKRPRASLWAGHWPRYYTLGTGIMLAGDDPLIGSVSPELTVSEGESATIWVDDVTTFIGLYISSILLEQKNGEENISD